MSYKRGQFKIKDDWSTDSSKCYYSGLMINAFWPLVKIHALIALHIILRYSVGLENWMTLCIIGFITVFFQNFMAMCFGLIPIPGMDQVTFLGNEKSIVNYINCAEYTASMDEFPQIFEEKLKEAFVTMPKLRYKITEVAGDFYYEMMSVEETF